MLNQIGSQRLKAIGQAAGQKVSQLDVKRLKLLEHFPARSNELASKSTGKIAAAPSR
ncbi:hypothetical protein [Bradyrhizobium commune]|uniref:Uncharacterized protein n=1 Tax=Bradyrhizobium commune TaxID=83627 RepID=A0A7S9D6T7_9BRAD|nr:hypothetical protein [Bradyrhizobium commune]QPF92103.1 hypothetical protein IC761_02005 [Bradyrhizobium commune]